MFKNLCILTILASFGCFLFGLRHLFLEVEENACRMTYMFGVPQFSQVKFVANKEYSHYSLYYYNEGRLLDVNNLHLDGAPVIYIPGNAGSYKQVRSLASVALRKGMNNVRGIHLDYFTINFEEQLSALYGGYLENQKNFLRLAINVVQRLYQKSSKVEKKVILIGHSMGGKVAQAVLQEPGIAQHVNSIIFISSPIDNPVVNFDSKINKFYTFSNFYLSSKRVSHLPNRRTDTCTNYEDRVPYQRNESMLLDNILMISIGGGNRDLLLRDGLTTSQYSDIHAMTSSIPNVWLSCDHLSAVWCLQLVMVINRFIFAIADIDDKQNVFFLNDKTRRTQMAIHYFVKPFNKYTPQEVDLLKSASVSSWQEDSKKAFQKAFKHGLRADYIHLLPIAKYENFKKIYIEIDSYDAFDNNWIYGCTARNVEEGNLKCEKGISLSHFVKKIPSHERYRNMVLVDTEYMLRYHPTWTHILVHLRPTNNEITLKIDAFKAKERIFNLKAPRWISIKPNTIINETVLGTIHYGILVGGIEDPFSTLELTVLPVSCRAKEYGVTAKICVPWARGFERYKHLNYDSKDKNIYVNAPISAPIGYNTTQNPISVELFLNANCRYKINAQFSLAGSTSKIVQEFYHWLPAHLTAVLFMVLRNQIVKYQNAETGLFVKPYAGFFQCKSLYIVTACRLLKKLLLLFKSLPITPDPFNNVLYVGILIHGTSIVLSIVAVFIIWTVLTFHGNVLHKIALRMTGISAAASDVLMKIINALPVTLGVLFISISLASCSGIGLTLASVYYFLMISNAYKDFLENWAWDKAEGLFKKIRAKFDEENKNVESVNAVVEQHEHLQRLTYVNETVVSKVTDGYDYEANRFFQGMENFAFHIAMLLLLSVMSMLNFGLGIAWIKSYYHGHHVSENLPDPFIVPTVTTLSCLSILLQLGAPRKSSGYRVIAVLLYLCTCACVLYCQENIYRLNYLIALVYLFITIQEIVHGMVQMFSRRS